MDEVFAEDGAFDRENVYKSLGRIYREWKDARTALDPGFDAAEWRQSR